MLLETVECGRSWICNPGTGDEGKEEAVETAEHSAEILSPLEIVLMIKSLHILLNTMVRPLDIRA